jgi:hypothetical protein
MPTESTIKIDLSDVPNQPLILKHQVDLYRDNTRQRPVNEKTASKYMGVYWEKNAGGMNKWHAQIMVDKRVYNLGKYPSEEGAAQVYANAAYKYKKSKAPSGVYGGLDLSNVPKQPLIYRLILESAVAPASKYKGVKRCRNKWQARIAMNGRSKELGTFDTEEAAAAIYAKAAFLVEKEKRRQLKTSSTACDRPLKRRKQNASSGDDVSSGDDASSGDE